MKNEIVSITPKIAEKWLESVSPEKQRPLMERTITEYASAMRLGHWVLTHQGIAFDADGCLTDGQHRLHAIVRSGVTVSMFVATGLPVKQGELYTFDAIDRGKVRGIGQQLQVRHGIRDANRIAAAARIIAQICTRTSSKMTVGNTLAIIDRFGSSLQFVNRSMKLNAMHKGSVLGSLAFCHRVMPKELNDFMERVGDGDGVSRGSPAFALRAHILTNGVKGGCLGGHERACTLCSMHAVLGNKITVIKQTSAGLDFFSDKQPRIVDEIASLFK